MNKNGYTIILNALFVKNHFPTEILDTIFEYIENDNIPFVITRNGNFMPSYNNIHNSILFKRFNPPILINVAVKFLLYHRGSGANYYRYRINDSIIYYANIDNHSTTSSTRFIYYCYGSTKYYYNNNKKMIELEDDYLVEYDGHYYDEKHLFYTKYPDDEIYI